MFKVALSFFILLIMSYHAYAQVPPSILRGNDGRHLSSDLESILNEIYEGEIINGLTFLSGSAKVRRSARYAFYRKEFVLTFFTLTRTIYHSCTFSKLVYLFPSEITAREYSTQFFIEDCIFYDDGDWFSWEDAHVSEVVPDKLGRSDAMESIFDLQERINERYNAINKYE